MTVATPFWHLLSKAAARVFKRGAKKRARHVSGSELAVISCRVPDAWEDWCVRHYGTPTDAIRTLLQQEMERRERLRRLRRLGRKGMREYLLTLAKELWETLDWATAENGLVDPGEEYQQTAQKLFEIGDAIRPGKAA